MERKKTRRRHFGRFGCRHLDNKDLAPQYDDELALYLNYNACFYPPFTSSAIHYGCVSCQKMSSLLLVTLPGPIGHIFLCTVKRLYNKKAAANGNIDWWLQEKNPDRRKKCREAISDGAEWV